MTAKEIKEIIGYYIVCPIISLVFAYATFDGAKELYVLYKGNEFKATITEVEIIKSTKSKDYKISFEYEGKKMYSKYPKIPNRWGGCKSK